MKDSIQSNSASSAEAGGVNLLPCPFCGADDSLDNACQQAGVTCAPFKSPAGGVAYRVECCCGAAGSSARFEFNAVAAWNRRAPLRSKWITAALKEPAGGVG